MPLKLSYEALPGHLGIQGEGLFIFRDLGRKHNFLGAGSRGAKEKHFRELGRKVIFLSGSREQRTPLGGLSYDNFLKPDVRN